VPDPPSLPVLSALLAVRASALTGAAVSPLAPLPYLDLVRQARDVDDLATGRSYLTDRPSRSLAAATPSH
jgi:hypothetical protein